MSIFSAEFTVRALTGFFPFIVGSIICQAVVKPCRACVFRIILNTYFTHKIKAWGDKYLVFSGNDLLLDHNIHQNE
jgi:hypothetical protein